MNNHNIAAETEKHDLKKKDSKIIKQIAENYIRLERSITSQLRVAAANHHVTSGSFREEVWKSMFEQIIPRKFSIEQSVFIIDSNGQVSKEVDLAIFDEQYTPFIFRYGRIKYIPIEAVAVVIQCKSTNIHGAKLREWSDSITKLNTSLRSIARMFNGLAMGEYSYTKNEADQLECPQQEGQYQKDNRLTQTSTRPVQILCHIKKGKNNKYIAPFDIVISPERDRLKVNISPELQEIGSWYDALNHKEDKDKRYEKIKKKFDNLCPNTLSGELKTAVLQMDSYRVFNRGNRNEEIGILSLTFLLNQVLMLINNPILFPHLAYVEMFNRELINAKD